MIRRGIAEWLNNRGMKLENGGNKELASKFYSFATGVDPGYSAPWYNLGLQAKYAKLWQESLWLNQKAVGVNSENESAWWNLGIAATAVHDWEEALRAWRAYGIDVENVEGEVLLMSPARACVRLNPGDSGEVVWGTRLDPARTVILNVPLPESKHRFHDVVLNDGAQNGTRVDEDGREVPVFDELEIWQKSSYSTFEVHMTVSNEKALDALSEVARSRKLGIEDWSTIRFLCAACSSGAVGPHEHKPTSDQSIRTMAFGAESYEELMTTLTEWAAEHEEIELGHVEMVLDASK